MYQDYVANKAKEKTNQLEQYYSQVLSKVQAELSCILLSVFFFVDFILQTKICRTNVHITNCKHCESFNGSYWIVGIQ